MYAKKELLKRIDVGDVEEANDILFDLVEKLLKATKGEFEELKSEWGHDQDIEDDLQVEEWDGWGSFDDMDIIGGFESDDKY